MVRKKSNLKVNAVCMRFFREHLAREYGAGHLGNGHEVPGWDRWMNNGKKVNKKRRRKMGKK